MGALLMAALNPCQIIPTAQQLISVGACWFSFLIEVLLFLGLGMRSVFLIDTRLAKHYKVDLIKDISNVIIKEQNSLIHLLDEVPFISGKQQKNFWQLGWK